MNLSDVLSHPVFTDPQIVVDVYRNDKKTKTSVFINNERFDHKQSFTSVEASQLEQLMMEAYGRKFPKTCSKACKVLYPHHPHLVADALFASVQEGFPKLLLESVVWMPQKLKNEVFFHAIEMVQRIPVTTIEFIETVCSPNQLNMDATALKSFFWGSPENMDTAVFYYLKYNSVEALYKTLEKMPPRFQKRYEDSLARVQQKKLEHSLENELHSAVPSKRKL